MKFSPAYWSIVVLVLYHFALGTCPAHPPMAKSDKARTNRQLAAFIRSRLTHFSVDGQWQGDPDLKPNRSLEPLALSHALLASGDTKAISQANAYLSNANDLEWHRATFILLRYKALLTEKSRQNIRLILDRIAPEYLKPSWDFVGTNDNFPAMATAGCALYGEISGKKEYIQKAYERLLRFKAQLERSGVNSEYSSQAYCFLQIEPMAMLAEFTANAKLKTLALQVEERFWFDVLGHYYLPAHKMAAPYSRAYAWDMRGAGLTYSMLESVIPQLVPFQYLDDYFGSSEEWIKCRNAACYGITYHCPQYLVDELVNRKYLYSFIATADGSPGSDELDLAMHGLTMQTRTANEDDGVTEYGSWQTRIETYMTPKYALSSSLIPFHSGAQTENFLLVYPRKTVGQPQRNTATVFSRLVVNDQFTLKTPSHGYGDYGVVFDEMGRRMAIQEKNTVMVIYKPKPFLNKGLTSLRTCVFIPHSDWMTGPNPLDEVWIGDEKLAQKTGVSSRAEPVFVKDGNVYMAYIPLIGETMGGQPPVTVEEKEGYTILSFYNYRGPAIDLARRDLQNKGNGFICEVASSDEYPSFEAFRKVMLASIVHDEYRTYVHYRSNMVRNTKYERKGLSIEHEYSPGSEGIRFSAVNGQYLAKPRLKVSGGASSKIPLNTPELR
ncbi:hypothetical protein WBJ53_33215 (plasmid) [Spirosoma sp. SC4-14]|uniref:hypothetical protein n=1 Tax=Spirosoma sp. SC4-14 TaxID=3128900 RepID=UPI0030CE8A01